MMDRVDINRYIMSIVALMILVLLMVASFSLEIIHHVENPRNDLSHLELHRRLLVDHGASRPKMHTYYEKAKTDMTDEADIDLLENWKNAWWDAGWEPVIISQWDAMNLPEYNDMIDLIVDPDFIGQYNMQCYIRYLAMSAVGGGWMS
jgi:hypothetical protein